jgi:hypothetical protein
MALPKGHAETGRAVFQKMGCTSCHKVAWETDFPDPTASVEAPMLTARLAQLTPGYVATSIAAPSYNVGDPYRHYVPGGLSPMADYSGAMTVRDLVDLVAYLQRHESEPRPAAQTPLDRSKLPHHL